MDIWRFNSLMPRELRDHHDGDRLTGGYTINGFDRSAGPSYSIQLRRMLLGNTSYFDITYFAT